MNLPTLYQLRRREALARATALGALCLFGPRLDADAADAPLETTRVRLTHRTSICIAPQYIAEEFLRMEGFTDVEYRPIGSRDALDALADARVDITLVDAHSTLPYLDSGKPLVVLSGVHGGCYQVFGHESVRAIRDLKGKTVAIHYFGGGDHVLLSSMLAYVGLNPKDVNWVTGRDVRNAMDLFIEGKADAFAGFAQEPAELRARKVGTVIVDTGRDRPWNQYFCCMVVANRDFVARNPNATKRALRAILKAADICDADPERAARFLFEMRYEPRYPIALEVMKNLQYSRWRDSNPEDTLRFHALRLREGGMIKSTPQQLIARGTDWRFLNEVKRELKA